MPKSKRNKQVDLTNTKKHGIEGKKNLYNEIRSCVDTYTHIFIFTVNDMRNSKMKEVRHQWRHSRFFIGKNKVMALALGRSIEESYKPNLYKIGEQLKGQKGLLFSNQPVDEVLKFFSSYSEGDFARSGNVATEDVTLSEGPLPEFAHSLESYLRQLGLPTTLKKGVIHLVKDHVVCKTGDQLTPETARILKLLNYEMAEFQIKMECVWSQDGTFQDWRTGPAACDNDEEEMELVEKDTELAPADENEEEADSEGENQVNGQEAVDENENFEKVAVDTGSILKITQQEIEPTEVKPSGKEAAVESLETEAVDTDSILKITQDEIKPTKVKPLRGKAAVKSLEKEAVDTDSILKITQEKIESTEVKPTKYSPRMTRARAAAKNDPKPPSSAAKTPRKRKM